MAHGGRGTLTATTSPLRVLFVGLNWPPETFLARLIRGLAAHGVGVTIATADRPDAVWRNMPNVEFLKITSWTGSKAGRLARMGAHAVAAAGRSVAATARAWGAAHAKEAYLPPIEGFARLLPFAGRRWDVIYFPWNVTAILYLPLMDSAMSVVSCRGAHINITPHNPDRARQLEWLAATFDKAAAVHCVSEAIRDEATQYGLDPAKTTIIRPAVDPDVFRPAEQPRMPDGDFRVITTGTVMWRKGYEYALSAVRALLDRGVPVRFDIIGDGDEMQRLLYTIHDLSLTERVACHGRLAPSEVVARLQQSDVFLLSSLSEGISNAALEAMACGLPVVTTRAGGMAEAVTDGVEGFVVPLRDPETMTEALDELWRQPELRRRMGAAGRERVLRDFRLDDQAGAFLDLFRSVA